MSYPRTGIGSISTFPLIPTAGVIDAEKKNIYRQATAIDAAIQRCAGIDFASRQQWGLTYVRAIDFANSETPSNINLPGLSTAKDTANSIDSSLENWGQHLQDVGCINPIASDQTSTEDKIVTALKYAAAGAIAVGAVYGAVKVLQIVANVTAKVPAV